MAGARQRVVPGANAHTKGVTGIPVTTMWWAGGPIPPARFLTDHDLRSATRSWGQATARRRHPAHWRNAGEWVKRIYTAATAIDGQRPYWNTARADLGGRGTCARRGPEVPRPARREAPLAPVSGRIWAFGRLRPPCNVPTTAGYSARPWATHHGLADVSPRGRLRPGRGSSGSVSRWG